jgi:hypothetical protein
MTNTKTESDDEDKARLLDGPLRNVNEIEDVPHRSRLAWVHVPEGVQTERDRRTGDEIAGSATLELVLITPKNLV